MNPTALEAPVDARVSGQSVSLAADGPHFGSLPETLLTYRRPIILGLHLLLIPLSYALSFALRFDLDVPPNYLAVFWTTLPLLLGVRLAGFAIFRLYNGWWRHVGIYDLSALLKAVTFSSALFVSVLFFTGTLGELPRSILLIDWMLAVLFFGGIRFGVRWAREGGVSMRRKPGKRALIIGAGNVGAQLLRQIRMDPRSGIVPVGLVDDNPLKEGMEIHGVRVLGGTRDLRSLVTKREVQLVVVAIASATREDMRRISGHCKDLGVEFKIVPSLREMLDGRVRLNELRSVKVEDLLGREPVRLHMDQVSNDLRDQVVLITGGAGSIGSELARQIARYSPSRLLLLEQAESPLYYVHLELAAEYPQLQVVPIVADVTDARRVEQIFAEHRPTYVFHAAAYKHVPMMETNVCEAVRNNVFGTLNIGQCAAEYGARKFVLISTDKAVNPSSIMGATKRIAERIVLGFPDLRASGTDFRAVRFGNVLGSDGSVVPLFKRQIAAGGPVTVTHPEMTRYFMTIPEAVQLVLQAAALPEAANRISMLEMGQPVRILEMAENLIRLSGLEPYTEMPVVFTGVRPGEKLHEELMSEVERTIPTTVDKIRIVETDEADGVLVQRALINLSRVLTVGRSEDLAAAVCAMVPECVEPLRQRGRWVETGAQERVPLSLPIVRPLQIDGADVDLSYAPAVAALRSAM